MHVSRGIRQSFLTLLTALFATAAFAQATSTPAKPAGAQDKPAGQFEPRVGQPGKDVVWVPTPQALVDKMLDMAKVTPNDFVMDLGSGDGRTVITAAKRGATAMGIEYNPDMVELSKRNAQKEGVSAKATFVQADLFKTDLSKATVITMFLLPSINMQLRPSILNLKPGTRIVANTFTMEDWDADETQSVTENCSSWCTALLWIVPAKVQGTWKTPQGNLTLTQTFQNVTGNLNGTAITAGKLNGDQISLTVGGTTYTGSLDHRFNEHQGIHAEVFDTVETFGRSLTSDFAGLPTDLDVSRDPLTGGLGGCVFSTSGGGGSCFDRSLSSITGSTFRMRGGSLVFSGQRRLWSYGLGAGYAHRNYARPAVAGVASFAQSDDVWSVYGTLGRQLSRTSNVSLNAFASWYSNNVDPNNVRTLGATLSYDRRLFLERLQMLASVGIYNNDDGTDSSTNASALGGLRYTF